MYFVLKVCASDRRLNEIREGLIAREEKVREAS